MDSEKAIEITGANKNKGFSETEMLKGSYEIELLKKESREKGFEILDVKARCVTLEKERNNLREDNCYLAQTVEKMTREIEAMDRKIREYKEEAIRQAQVLVTVSIREGLCYLTYEYLNDCVKQAESDKGKLAKECRRLEDENTILSLEKDYIIEGYKEKIAGLKKEISAHLLLSGADEFFRLRRETYFLKEELERAKVRRDQAVNSEKAIKDTLDMVSGENEALKKVMREDFPVKIIVNVDRALVEKNKELMEEKIKLLKELEEYKDSVAAISGITEVFCEILPNSMGTIFAL